MSIELIRQFYFSEPVLAFLKSSIVPGFLDGIVDYWLIIHFSVGIILFFLLKNLRNPMMVFWVLNIGYEIFEIFLFQRNLAIPEQTLNQLLDSLVTYLGYKLAEKKLR